MKTAILFGGGDGGGLIITANGVRPIPPFDPSILLSLRSAASMVMAMTQTADKKARGNMAKLSTTLCNLAVGQVEEALGPLGAEGSLIFQSEDGGFTCGSTGKPPIPLPWPPRATPSLPDLISAGVIESDLIGIIREGKSKKVKLIDILEQPGSTAQRLGLTLSAKTERDLQALAPSKLSAIEDATDREVIGFFHKVAEDGRFLETWFERPYEVASSLNVTLSEAAFERLITRGADAA